MPYATLLNVYQLTNLEWGSNLGFRSQKYMTSIKKIKSNSWILNIEGKKKGGFIISVDCAQWTTQGALTKDLKNKP
jgi:hypothetical protein